MRPLTLLFVALFNSILGLSVLFPVLGPLGRTLGLSELEVGLFTTGYATTQFLMSAYWGRASEVRGRKPILLVGILGFALTFLAFAVIADLGRRGVLAGAALFVALLGTRLLGGALSSATLPTVQAYVADVTGRADRASGMAVVGAAFGLGMGAAFGLGIVFGPAIGALLAPVDLLLPVYVSSGVAFLNALFVFLKLPEPERKLRRDAPPPLGPVAARLPDLLLISFSATLSSVAMEQTVSFYFQDRLELDAMGTTRVVGLSLFVYGVVAVLVQGGFVRRVRLSPLHLVRIGVPIAVVGLAGLTVAHSLGWLIVFMALQGLGQGLTLPGVTAAISLRARDDEQGAAAGLTSSSQALARVIGPVLGTGLYQLRPELPYVVGAGLMLIVGLFAFVARPEAST
jgi:MFS family permease